MYSTKKTRVLLEDNCISVSAVRRERVYNDVGIQLPPLQHSLREASVRICLDSSPVRCKTNKSSS